ncbi:MAG: thiamine diphosphokinase [Ruminococcus sp.]|jgi:thiamine pyrophosphokinase|nr:thiamine diphosphokinase [Ruminococcus sp.]
MNKRVFIFAAGMYYDDIPQVTADDFIIAADGGYIYTSEHEIIPDLIIGDFDSSKKDVNFAGEVITLPKEKDVTDTAAAVNFAAFADEFHIYGGTGGRFDHTLANIALIAELSRQGKHAYLYGDGVIITALTNGKIALKSKNSDSVVSIFSFTDRCKGVTVTGLKYPLTDAVLTSGVPLGVSNETLSGEFTVEVKNGTLVIFYEKIIG